MAFRLVLFHFALATSASAVPALATDAGVQPIEERMTDEEFRAAGLDRLSVEQLEFLNRWLDARGAGSPAATTPSTAVAGGSVGTGDSVGAGQREKIESRIVGAFRGWHGRTIVTLENGQKWQQSESGTHGDVDMTGPAVVIKPMSMGSWLMVVKGCNCSVRVKRVG